MPPRFSSTRKSGVTGRYNKLFAISTKGNASSATGNVNTIKKNAFKEYI